MGMCSADLEHHLQVIQRLQAELAEHQASAEERRSRVESNAAKIEASEQGRSGVRDDRHRGSRHGEQSGRHGPARGSGGGQPYSARDARPPRERVEPQKGGHNMSILGAATSGGRPASNADARSSHASTNVRPSDINESSRPQHGHRRTDSRDTRDTRPPSAARGLSDRDTKRRR